MELPRGWVSRDIGELFNLVGGGTPSTENESFWGNGIPWFSSADIDYFGNIKSRRRVTKEGIENSTTNVVPENTVIIVSRVGLGKIAILREKMCFSQDIQALNPIVDGTIDQKYLYYHLIPIVKKLKYNGRGTTISGVTKKQLSDENINIPPFAEQHRIVEKIDALFSELDKGVEILQTVKEQLKTYRQSVLKSAFEGKLTEDNPNTWDYKSPDELSALQKHALTIGPFGSDLKVSDYTESGVPLIFVRDIRSFFRQNTQKFISEDKARELSAHQVTPGDILITKMGDPPGDCCIYPPSREIGIITADCIKWTVDSSLSIPEYIIFAIRSPYVKVQISGITRGVAQKKISLDRFRKILIPIPRRENQIQIVEAIESRLSVCDKVEQLVDENLAKADALRQSILKKAFEGRLVPQDPNDEPAEKLLERIKAERAAAEQRMKQQKSVKRSKKNG